MEHYCKSTKIFLEERDFLKLIKTAFVSGTMLTSFFMLLKMTSQLSKAEQTISFVTSNYKIQQQTCPKYLRMISE